MKNVPENISVTITTKSITRIVLVGMLLAGVYVFWDLVLVILMAVVIASAIEPLTRSMVRLRIPRLAAVVGIYLGSALALTALAVFFLPPVLDDAAGLLGSLPRDLNLADLIGPISENGPEFLKPGIDELSHNLSLSEIILSLRSSLSDVSGSFFAVVSTVFGGVMSFALIFILSFYLAVQEDGFAGFLRLITPVQHEKYVIDLWRRAQVKIGKWLQGQVILMLVVGVLVYLGLTVLGVPYALFLAIVAGLFEIIPLFGPILAAVPGVAVSFVDGGLTAALIVVGLYIIIQQFENQLIHPLVVSKVVGVPPLLVIIALIIGARLAGFLGLVLSVPLAAAFREYVSDVQKARSVRSEQYAAEHSEESL